MKSGSRYLVAVGAVSDGWCAWLDTASGVLEPLDIRERPRQAFLPPANPAHAMAASWLDRIRDRPEGDEAGREALLQELVSRVPAAGIREALRGRMREVGRSHGGILLQLLESLGDAPLLDELAAAVESEPGLPADRAWEVLSLLEATGLLEDRPILAEMHAELAELLDEGEASLGELAAQIEDEPDGVVLALEGLEEVEPEVRAAILEGLASQPVGPGLVEFLRLLAAHPEPLTKAAAREVLETLAATDARAALAWRWVAEEGGGPHRQLEQTPNPERREVIPVGASGSVAHAVVVGDVDGDGRATLGFVSRDGEGWTAAVFTCDVNDGVVAVSGLYTEDRADAMAVLGTIAGVSSEGRPAVGVLGRELLAGCLWLSGALSPTALRYWVERAVDAHLRPGPLPAPSFEPSPGSLEELRRDAEAVLVALPLWRDTSKLAEDLAREVHERAGRSGPIDDPAVRRLLFERRVRDRIPVLQRMLIWQALLWQAAGAEALSQSARRLAASLLGPEQVLPTHPFLDAYLRRSLEYGNGSSTSSDPHTPRRLANGS